MEASAILHDARAAVEGLAARLGALLEHVPDGRAPIAGSQWSVRDATAHLISGTALYADIATGTASPLGKVGPEPLRRFNAERLADIVDQEPGVLAKSLAAAVGQFAAAVDQQPGDAPVRWHGGIELQLAQLTGVLLGEFVIHGYDIATALRAPWQIDPVHAALVMYGYGPLFAVSTDPATSRGHSATYALDVGVAGRFTVCFDDGVMVAPPEGVEADCEIVADPVAFLLMSTGRLDLFAAIALGLFRVGGRRPELGLAFGGLFLTP